MYRSLVNEIDFVYNAETTILVAPTIIFLMILDWTHNCDHVVRTNNCLKQCIHSWKLNFINTKEVNCLLVERSFLLEIIFFSYFLPSVQTVWCNQHTEVKHIIFERADQQKVSVANRSSRYPNTNYQT